jgi:signal transduction histidine kinase
MTWATGSDLTPRLRSIRIKLTSLSFVLLLILLFFSGYNTVYTTRLVLESEKQQSFAQGLIGEALEEFTLRDKVRRLDALQDIQLIILYSNVTLLLVLTGISWMVLYFLLKPIHKEQQKREQFLSHASHELRTPLAILKSDLQLLAGENNLQVLDEARLSFIEEVDRLNQLSNTLLAGFSNRNDIQDINVRVMLRKILAAMKKINKNNIKVVLRHPQLKQLVVRASHEKLYQILFNLVDNAFRYATPKTECIIDVLPIEGRVIVTNVTEITALKQGIGLEITHKTAEEIGGSLTCVLEEGIYIANLTLQQNKA